MIRPFRKHLSWLMAALFLSMISAPLRSDELNVNMEEYRAQPGLKASVDGEVLTILWDGEGNRKLRIRFALKDSIPVISELAVSSHEGTWSVIGEDMVPEFHIVSGIRRVTQQQTRPLEELGVPLTASLLDSIKWEAFWDAPLYTEDELPPTHRSSIPATESFASHPGMPRKPEEVDRATATYHATGCEVSTNGARLEIRFPGVKAGIFEGFLQFDVFRGSGLVRQMLVARTNHPSVAFKYDAGVKGLPAGPSSRSVWRDLAGNWQGPLMTGLPQEVPVVIKSRNRLIAAEVLDGALAVFPPPHSFFWARETEENLGYSWYRKDTGDRFSIGIRQAETEENPEFYHNFALYSARPGTWQRMPVFLLIGEQSGKEAIGAAMAFTHDDRYKPLEGYKVMGHHYHAGLLERLREAGGLDQRLNDVETMRSLGIDIYSVIDGVRGPARHDRGEGFLATLDAYYEAARRQSDREFLLMPNDENSTGGRPPFLGGHYDLLISKPLYWTPGREAGESLSYEHPEYGTVYRLGTPEDLMQMSEEAGVLVSLPHPRTKGSTGYPDAIRDTPQFLHSNYFSLGYRWGMGIDASEIRLGEYRFLTLWDEVNNWMAAKGLPPKYALAISEVRTDYGGRGRPPYDDAYGMSPVNYLRLDQVPEVDDMSPVIETLRKGNYFVTSGEVLIPHFSVEGTGAERTVTADVEWTFPLDFVEVVWGDGERTDRLVISTTDLEPFGRHRFEIPVDVSGKMWIRFAAWDVATNGAMVQPVPF